MVDKTESAEGRAIHLTAWHVFLAEMVKFFTDERRVDVRDFDKLGKLPLEADVMLLRKHDLEAQSLEPGPLTLGALSFLDQRLGEVTALEYKGPTDYLGWEDVDTARVYALLGKRKYKLERDSQVRVMMMYSHARVGLFDRMAADGLAFEQEEEGILCHRGSIVMYAMDLVTLGKRQPHSPLNLISARHRHYVREPDMDERTLALVDRIEYLIEEGTVKGMRVSELKGSEEIKRDVEEIRRQFLENIPAEQRLEGLGADEKVKLVTHGLGADEKAKLVTQVLKGMGPSERAALLKQIAESKDT